MSNIFQDGNYAAVTKAASVYQKDGKLLLAFSFDMGGTELKSYFVVVQAGGAVNTATIGRIREWATEWDGTDPYWFIEAAKTGIAVELAVKMEPGFKDPSKLYPKIKWVNKAGGGSGLPEMADRKTITAKYGARFRAAAGPQPLAATPPQRPQPSVSVPPPDPRQGGDCHATLDECWRLMQQRTQGGSPEQITAKWYAAIDATGTDQADMTPEGWDRVKESILAGPPGGGTEDPGLDEDNEPMPF